jgi:hypothetical protein
MRLSLWQSFSSNHSAPFTLVGVFGSATEAKAAAAWLRALWHDIVTWRIAASASDPHSRWQFFTSDLTPPERTAADALGIQWGPLALDWCLPSAADPTLVTTLDQWLFVDGNESYAGAYQTEQLVAALGGQSVVAGWVAQHLHQPAARSKIRLQLTARVSNAAVGQAVAQAVQQDWREVTVDLSRLPEHQVHLVWDEFNDTRVEVAALRAYLQGRRCHDIVIEFSDVRSAWGEEG